MNCRLRAALLGGLILAGAILGCATNAPPPSPPGPPTVPVSHPVQREVTNYVDYTGRTDAVQSVGVRARVTGYIDRAPFKEGSEVKKGDLLFEIDPRPYKAQLDQALGQVELNQASLRLAETTYARDRAIANSVSGAVSQQQLDQDKAAVDEAQARIKASKAAVEVYNLNLGFTKVTSPISGMVSRYYYTPGNMVIQDQTLLTTVVSLDPMYAYFDMDEPTLLRVKKAINEGKIQRPRPVTDIRVSAAVVDLWTTGVQQQAGSPWRLALLGAHLSALLPEVPILMGLQGEDGYLHKGHFNFINNVINPSTGTIAVRGVFENLLPKDGTRLLLPGMFVRIRLPIGQPHKALLVIDRAVGSDQGLKFVYVVNAENKVEYRRVTTGPLQEDGLRVIEDGLHPDDLVVTGGLQQVRPRLEVAPDEMPMPTLVTGQAPPAVNKQAQPPPAGNKTR